MRIASSLVFAAVVIFAFSSHAADAIVSGQPATQHYGEYPYNLLMPFFAIACSALLITLIVHYYTLQ